MFPVSKVMKKGLHTLKVSGSTIQEIEEELSRTDAKGFPIVSSDTRQIIMGYIGRTELRYIIGPSVLSPQSLPRV